MTTQHGLSISELQERIAAVVQKPEPGSQVEFILNKYRHFEFTVKVNGEWRLEGFVNLFQKYHELARAVDPSYPSTLPAHCFSAKHIAEFFRLPEDAFSEERMDSNGTEQLLHDTHELVREIHHTTVQKSKQRTQMKRMPHSVATAGDVIARQQWLMDRSTDPTMAIPVQVDLESETITVSGVKYDIDRQMAAVVQCLLNAKGELRSTAQMKVEYPDCIFDKRLDITIARKLKTHKSSVGQFIKSDKRGYRLVWQKCE